MHDQMIDERLYHIDGIDLDKDNQEFNTALDLAVNTEFSLYITGKAGTGKSTFLKYLNKIAGKNMIVLAPTGVAAINAGGQTIHSFFKIRPSVYPPDDPRLKPEKGHNEEGPSISDYFAYNQSKIDMLTKYSKFNNNVIVNVYFHLSDGLLYADIDNKKMSMISSASLPISNEFVNSTSPSAIWVIVPSNISLLPGISIGISKIISLNMTVLSDT